MDPEIIPIELSLTDGNGITLWAPRWREDGEEWEAFLGHEDKLYLFPDAAHLAAFIRTNDEHDLADHPDWAEVKALLADELQPDEDHRFDIVGVPVLVADAPDIWSLATLADTVSILRSLAEVCDLERITKTLDASSGFTLAAGGPTAFIGRAGQRLWDEVGQVVATQWDGVIESLDGIVNTPDVDADALAQANSELEQVRALQLPETDELDDEAYSEELAAESDEEEAGQDRDPDLAFWDDLGVDCVSIGLDKKAAWTLRCYLDDAPVFLATDGRIKVFSTPAKLETFCRSDDSEHDLAGLEAWRTIHDAVDSGDASVIAGPENTYDFDGLDDQLLQGPKAVDAGQLELAVELLRDAGTARKDGEVDAALGTASPLGNLVSAIIKPDARRLVPAPPFDDEVTAWRALVASFAGTLDWDPAS